MKTISIIGKQSEALQMFMLELSWVISKNSSVYCKPSSKEFYECFSEEQLLSTNIANLTIVSDFKEIYSSDDENSYIICNEYIEDSDYIILLAEQNIFSVNTLNSYAKKIENQECILVFLDFLPSSFDDHYLKNFLFDKRLILNSSSEYFLEFDERTKIQQLENQFNKTISFKKYPKLRKLELLNLSKELSEEDEPLAVGKFYKQLDERISIC